MKVVVTVDDSVCGNDHPDGLPKPGPFYILVKGEDMTNLVCDLLFPEKPSNDTERWRIRVNQDAADGVPISDESFAATLPSAEFKGPKDTTVHVRLTALDAKNNDSSPRERLVLLEDTIAPPQPGEFAVTAVREEEVA
jgi:hypothetical protein